MFDVEFVVEATARSMDRIHAGLQPIDGGVRVAIRLEDIEAVLAEMESGAPCGICGQQRCRERRPAEEGG